MERDIKFKYIFQKDYNPVHVNGVYGGIAPSGDLVANFYYERQPIPKSETATIDENGQLNKTSQVDPENFSNLFVRHITCGISMNLQFAEILHKWLGEQLQLAKQKNQANKEDGDDE